MVSVGPQASMETLTLMVIKTRRTLRRTWFKIRQTGHRNSNIVFLPIKVLFVLKLKLYNIHMGLHVVWTHSSMLKIHSQA